MKINYLNIFLFLLAILINPFFLKLFTIDGKINLLNLSLFLNVCSISLFVIFYFSFFYEPKKIILRSFSITFFLFVSILICEFFYSKLSQNKPKKYIKKTENYEFTANYIHNKDGFRDDNFDNLLDNQNLIFLIGDSFVYGSAVDEPYTIDKLLEEKLNKINSNFKTVNLGIPGVGPDRYLKILKEYIKYKPKLIFMFIYIDNDINKVYDKSFLSNLDQILKKSFLINSLKILFKIKVSDSNLKYYRSDKYLNQFDIPKSTYEIFKYETVNQFVLSIANRGNLDEYYTDLSNWGISNYYKNIFIEAKNISELSNSEFHLVLIPSKYQTNIKYVDYAIKNLGYKFFKKQIIDDKIQKQLGNFAEKNSIKFIDLTPHLKSNKNNNYYMIDDHFNENGNLLTSKILYEYIVENKLVN